MSWGTLIAHEEVAEWLKDLPDRDFGRAMFQVQRLADSGPLLGTPHTRHLSGRLWELRFSLSTGDWRVTYTIASARRIVLLTVFMKTRQREHRQIARAQQALQTSQYLRELE